MQMLHKSNNFQHTIQWLTQADILCLKSAKDKVKRPEGPPARNRGPECLLDFYILIAIRSITCICHIDGILFVRWIKYEEVLEPETGEWSNAHVSNLSFQSMIGLRYQTYFQVPQVSNLFLQSSDGTIKSVGRVLRKFSGILKFWCSKLHFGTAWSLWSVALSLNQQIRNMPII